MRFLFANFIQRVVRTMRCTTAEKYYLIFHIILFFTLAMPLACAEYAFIGEALIKGLRTRFQVKYVKLERNNYDETIIVRVETGFDNPQIFRAPAMKLLLGYFLFNDRIGLTIIATIARIEIHAPRIHALSSANATSNSKFV